MTIHDWLLSFTLGESRPIPPNSSYYDLADYAKSRFGYRMDMDGSFKIKRVCPQCGR